MCSTSSRKKKLGVLEVDRKIAYNNEVGGYGQDHGMGVPAVGSRWVAREFKGHSEFDRENMFSATRPIELTRLMISRQATKRADGVERKTMYLDAKNAHLAPECARHVYVERPEEARASDDECGKWFHWLYGCRPAAQAWEEHYSALLEEHGFARLQSVPVAFLMRRMI